MASNWTAANMPDLSGKVIVVTGANSGIGFEAAKEFARKGAQTVLACRSTERASAALQQITREIPGAQAAVLPLNLGSLASVHAFAEAFAARYDRLDVLLNNAGIMWTPYGTTEDGFEQQLGTNHLGHFALTGLLLDRLLSTPRSRVVSVSSVGHRSGAMDFDNLMFEGGRGYGPHRAYGRSKLANLLFTYELQRRFAALGSDATALAAHPGGSNTNLSRHVSGNPLYRVLEPLMPLLAQSPAMGALPSIRAAVDPQAQGGAYYGPDGFMETRGHPVVVQSNRASHDIAVARRLWEASEQLTGVRYRFTTPAPAAALA